MYINASLSDLSLFSFRRNFACEAEFFFVFLTFVLHQSTQTIKNSAPRAKFCLEENSPYGSKFAKYLYSNRTSGIIIKGNSIPSTMFLHPLFPRAKYVQNFVEHDLRGLTRLAVDFLSNESG